MKKTKIVAGIFWAFAGLIIMIIFFPMLNSLSASVSRLPFMKINPRYSGGDVAYTIVESKCTLDVRKPVFNGLFRERNSGFVQIDWRGTVPDRINDTIDFDRDGRKDFCILIDRKSSKTDLKPLNSDIENVSISTQTSYGWAVRIGLRKGGKS
jgi:hypothetical protein